MSLFTPLPKHTLTHRQKALSLSQPRVMGILNVTPDSFSDGGEHQAVQAAIAHCERMISAGVDIIDIGGESTRPNASAVSTDEELSRVVPVVEQIRHRFGDDIWLSIDTSNPDVMQAAHSAGADIWNDVRALSRAGAMQMAAQLSLPVILMHMRGEPTTMNALAQYDNVVAEVLSELQLRINAAETAGIKRQNIVLDPGFGFAKDYTHHHQLLTHLNAIQSFDLPIMFAVSRKRYLGEVLKASGVPDLAEHDVKDRDAVGMAAALFAVQQGACIIRTHNVAMTKQGLSLWEQLSNAR